MQVFLDFEASSLGKQSYPIEVGWVFEDGRSHAFLIRPAPDWTDWDPRSEAIHHIARERLMRDGTPHGEVAQYMCATLAGHDLLASAPSWDGKWLSTLLRAAGLPRHSLRLRATDIARRECATDLLAPILSPDRLDAALQDLLARAAARKAGQSVAHRALADAEQERERWLWLCAEARLMADAARSIAAGGDSSALHRA